jgi:hypothetical protein
MRSLATIPRSARLIALLLIVSILYPCVGKALQPPRIIPHSAPINKPVGEVFRLLKSYFLDHVESRFQTVDANEKTATIIAKQTGIDSDRWRQWAACQTDPIHMLYQLNDAMVTLTIKLDRAPRDTTFMTVRADFRGIYGLAQDETTIECESTGALEDNMLALAGAQMPGGQGAAASNHPAP